MKTERLFKSFDVFLHANFLGGVFAGHVADLAEDGALGAPGSVIAS